jgi:UDP-glucose 4-epimerase
MNILVTGGAGYIGSHTCLELISAGYKVIVVDNLVNSKRESLRRVSKITKTEIPFYKIDLLNKEELSEVFQYTKIDAVIHFAGLKAVGESVTIPLRYYKNNVTGTTVLCEVMQEAGVHNLIFSSSATVYGDPHKVPISEDFPLQPTNPYGRSKLMIEQILSDLPIANDKWKVVLLRYFNPVGAHPRGEIGEDPNDIPNNLFPYVAQVAVGKMPKLFVFGNDYPTSDGTGVRDYIHVVDLAKGHLMALERFNRTENVSIYNLGTGRGYSVLEVVDAFEKASGKSIPFEIISRRPGDVAVCYADATKANQELEWSAKSGIGKMCADTWHWQSKNPDGYGN